MSTEPTAQNLFDRAFRPGREPRSPEYRAGVLYILCSKLGEIPPQRCPYQPGTCQADAWLSGTDEGHHIYNQYMEQSKNV